VPLALAVAVTSPWLASWLLKDARYAWVFVLGGVAFLAAILNGVLLATLSARGDIVRMAGSNMLGTVCGLLIFAPAAVKWGVTGGLFAASAVYLCSLLLTLILISSSTLVRVRDFIGRFDRAEARRIAAFYPMLVLHAVMSPLSLILIREHVASSLSLESAGLWQACWRLSETYLMVVMSSVTTQFMPRLGEVVNYPDRLRAEMLRTLGAAVAATAVCALAIFLFREWIIKLIFSSAFLPVADLIPMQLVGDVLKMGGVTLGYVLVATLRARWYMVIAVVNPAVFVGVARVLDVTHGVHGVTIAYAVSSLIQLVLSVVALRDLMFVRGSAHVR
jgi:polysaccharide transporter, PST family